MINTIIFDFGGVFIDLDKEATSNILDRLGSNSLSDDMIKQNENYEKGMIETAEFISFYRGHFPDATEEGLINAWNSIILDFPEYRLKFIEELHAEGLYQLILLSNTNELHIQKVIENMGDKRYNRFKNSFHYFYLSHEVKMRKPDLEVFLHLLETHHLTPNECLFIDDTPSHTKRASSLGINTWNIDSENEDVVSLFKINKDLFIKP